MIEVKNSRILRTITLLIAVCLVSIPALGKYGGGPVEPNFAAYYEPWELHIEPNTVSSELPLDLGVLTNFDHVNQNLGLEQAKDIISQNGFVVIEHDFGGFDRNRDDKRIDGCKEDPGPDRDRSTARSPPSRNSSSPVKKQIRAG